MQSEKCLKWAQKIRGRAVGLVNSGTPKEKIRVIFVFFIILKCLVIFMHIQVYAQNNFAHFSCIRHVCLTDTTRHSSNCVRRIWQRPERRVITARQDIHIKLFYIRRRLVIARKVLHHFWDSWTSHFRFLASHTKTGARYLCKIMYVCNKGWSLDALRQQLQSS